MFWRLSMPLDQSEEYAKNLLALKIFVETNLDAIKNEKRKIDPLDHSETLADFNKFLRAAETLIEKIPSAAGDPLALENIKSFFDERQGKSQFDSLEQTIGNRAYNPAIEWLYFIQGMVFELDPELESAANRNARLEHIAGSSSAHRVSPENTEDEDESLRKRFEALKHSNVATLSENEIKPFASRVSEEWDEEQGEISSSENGDLLQAAAKILGDQSDNFDNSPSLTNLAKILEESNANDALKAKTQQQDLSGPNFDNLDNQYFQEIFAGPEIESPSNRREILEEKFSAKAADLEKKLSGITTELDALRLTLSPGSPVELEEIIEIKSSGTPEVLQARQQEVFTASLISEELPELIRITPVPTSNSLPEGLSAPTPRTAAPITFMRDHSANINRLAKIERKKGIALTAENVAAHVEKVVNKIDDMHTLSFIEDEAEFLPALLEQKKKYPEKLAKWHARKTEEQAEHLVYKKATASLHKNLEAKPILDSDSSVVGFLIERKNGEATERCMQEMFDKNTGLTTIDVFTQQDDDLRQAVEEALKICPDGGHVTIDDPSNPERAMKVFLFAKAAGGDDKFQFGEDTKNVLEDIVKKYLSVNGPLKDLYKDAIDSTKPVSSEMIRERLNALAQTQPDTPHVRPKL